MLISTRWILTPRHILIPLLAFLIAAALLPAKLAAVSPEDEDTAGAVNTIVAEIGGEAIHLAELEAAVAGELTRLETERHRILQAGLERLVAERLVALEATDRGLTVEALLETEAATKPVTETDVDVFYDQNQAQIGQPKEAVAAQIRQHLESQRASEAQARFLAGLAERHGVQTHLEPPRLEIALDATPAKGGGDTAVTVVEFSDFECPFCARLQPALEKLLERYGDKVRLAFKQFPLNAIHKNAQKAAEASLCAERQGEFWAMHDALFAQPTDGGTALDPAAIKAHARELGLDGERFDACLDGGETAAQVAADLRSGQLLGVSGTPSLFVNGRPVVLRRGVDPFEILSGLVDEELDRADD